MIFLDYNPSAGTWSDITDPRVYADRYRTVIVESDGTVHNIGVAAPEELAYRTIAPDGTMGPLVTQAVADPGETVEVTSAIAWSGYWFVSFIIGGRYGRAYVARRSSGTWVVDEIIAGPTDPGDAYMPYPILYVYDGSLRLLWSRPVDSRRVVYQSVWDGSAWGTPAEFFDPDDLSDPSWRSILSAAYQTYEGLRSRPHLGYPVMTGYATDGGGSPGVDGDMSFVLSAFSMPSGESPSLSIPVGGVRRTVLLVRNFFDFCLDRYLGDYCALPFPHRCRNFDAIEQYRSHVSMPARGKAFRARGAVPTPLASDGDVIVLRFSVPVGFDAVITGIYHHYTGPGFRDGSGDIIWRLRTGVIYPRWMGEMLVEMGDLDAHFPISGLLVPGGRDVEYIVNVPNYSGGILPGSSQIVCSIEGWLIPRR